jgi:hypothetical protein
MGMELIYESRLPQDAGAICALLGCVCGFAGRDVRARFSRCVSLQKRGQVRALQSTACEMGWELPGIFGEAFGVRRLDAAFGCSAV